MHPYSIQQLGKTETFQFEFDGGVPPFTIKASGYANIGRTAFTWWGMEYGHWDAWTYRESNIKPTSVKTDSYGTTIATFTNMRRYYRYIYEFEGHLVVVVPIWIERERNYPMNWRVTVTDATGAVIYSDWLQMTW